MDYPCGKFGDCSFSRSGFIVRTDRQTDRQTDVAKRLTIVIVISNVNSNHTHKNVVHQSESESEYKCLTCNQKPTGSQFSLLHESN